MDTYSLDIKLVTCINGKEVVEEFSESGENSVGGLDTEEILQMFVRPRIQAAEFVTIKNLKAKYKES